jgi:hypothetical protein
MTDPTALPNFPPPPDEHPLRGRVLDVCEDLGILPSIDSDGDVAFTVGDPPQQLFVRCFDGEVPVMRVFGQWQLGAPVPDDALARLERCNDFTLQLNVAKVGIAGGNLIATCEHVVLPGVDLSALFQLSVDLVVQVVGAFYGSWDQGRHEAPEDGGQ